MSYTRKTPMNPEHWERIKNAFECACESDPGDRPQIISDLCGGDPELVAEVDKLLEQHEKMGDFLALPAVQFPESLPLGTVIAERYELEGLLGRGGMGEVYRAQDRLLQETVALKTIRADQIGSSSLLGSLQREIQTARKVTHPNVCRVFDLGVHTFADGSRPPLQFLSMELLQGETLQARIESKGRLTGDEALPLAIQLAEGLAAAHAAGIIHRDFKSGNVILVPGKDGDRAVITDFGLARPDRRTDSTASISVSGAQLLVGTIGYMSPEQFAGGPITPASDVYSLGIVLFEMVTGQLPFVESHIVQAALQRASGNIPNVRQLAPDLDYRWERVIRKCLATLPESRPSPASAVADALRRRSWRIPDPRLTRRHWIGVSAAAAVAVLAPLAWYERRQPYVLAPDAERWYEQGVAHVHETTYDAARKALEQSLSIDPNYGPSHAYLAIALRELDYPERAREEILSALNLLDRQRHSAEDVTRVKAAQYFVSASYDLAQPLIDDLARRAQGAKKQQAMIEQGMLAMYRSKPADAQQIFEKVLALDASNAGARLRIATVYARRGNTDPALRSFDESERLFRAANNIAGVTETLFQRGVFLARIGRNADAISTLDKGLGIAGDTGDAHHDVRLQLALGMVYGNLGQTARAQQAAEAGVQKAIESKMERAVAVGLLDLGNVFFARGQLDMADKYFLQGLEYARQTKAQNVEMRATLSLGSLRVEAGRPREAVEFIQKALPYYERGGFLRETTQALILLGSAQNQLGRVKDAELTLRKAVDAADRLGNREQSGNAHGKLAVALLQMGDFPGALKEEEQSLNFYANARGGLLRAFGLATLAQIDARAGLYSKALQSLSTAEGLLAKLEGSQTQLRASILNTRAEIAYSERKWSEASEFAHRALSLPDNAADLDARLLSGLALVWIGKIDAGMERASRTIQEYEQKDRALEAASGKLMLAQAFWENKRLLDARRMAQAALNFFQPLENWEAIWRCCKILGSPGAAEALARCRETLGPEMYQSYRERPDLRKLLP
ncbi:MAG TPA: protein kinase [Bryobacteraceae bacterium]|nr:protein kinase [Bryobacteraceae bacterium]